MNFFASSFGVNGYGLEPLGQSFADIFLKKGLALDSIGIAAQDQGASAEKRQDEVGCPIVVGEQIAFRITGLREINFVEVA